MGDTGIYHPFGSVQSGTVFMTGHRGISLKDHIAVDRVQLTQQVGFNLEAAVGEGGVAGGYFQWCQGDSAATEGELQVTGEIRRVEAET